MWDRGPQERLRQQECPATLRRVCRLCQGLISGDFWLHNLKRHHWKAVTYGPDVGTSHVKAVAERDA